jgi:hypothetical protein
MSRNGTSAPKRPFSGPPSRADDDEQPSAAAGSSTSTKTTSAALQHLLNMDQLQLLQILNAAHPHQEDNASENEAKKRRVETTSAAASFQTPTGGEDRDDNNDDSSSTTSEEDANDDRHTGHNGSFEVVVNKKKVRRSSTRSNTHLLSNTHLHSLPASGNAGNTGNNTNHSGRKTSTPQSKTGSAPAAPKARDLAVFITGCHRSLALFIKNNWTQFDNEFKIKFHPPTAFKVTGHSLKVVCINQQQKERLLQCHEICGESVKVTLPYGVIRNKATKKFVIHEVPTAFSDDDIKSATNAEHVRRIISRRTGIEQPTGVVVLDLHEPAPYTVNIGALVFRVKDYIPRPTRCTRCNSFSHRQHQCVQKARCVRCDSENHTYDTCPALQKPELLKCKNCGGAHSAAFPGCPAFVEQQRILKLKTKQHMSYRDAVQQIREEDNSPPAAPVSHRSTTRQPVNNRNSTRIASTKKDAARKQLQFPNNVRSSTKQINQHRNNTRVNKPVSTAAGNTRKQTAERDQSVHLIVLLYELSTHLVNIATAAQYSNTEELQCVSDRVYKYGCTVYGEHVFGPEVVDLEAVVQ